MDDRDCVNFLQWALPRLGLHWPGFRKVRGIVCKRVERRRRLLGLASLAAYRERLEGNFQEWEALRALCSIPISRFFRDGSVFQALECAVVPTIANAAVARRDRTLEWWSAGCASGEEAYTAAILWVLRLATRYPTLGLHVLATDVDDTLLERAAVGCYRWSSLREVPEALRQQAFVQRGEVYCVRDRFRVPVTFERQDIRQMIPQRRFDLIFCRNLALTYFEPQLQRAVTQRLADALWPGGALVVGMRESPPPDIRDLVPWPGVGAVFRKVGGRT
jgi:chemotaxis protein methyltransferase CheR